MSREFVHLLIAPGFGLLLTVLAFQDERFIFLALNRYWLEHCPGQDPEPTRKLVRATTALTTFIPNALLFVFNSALATSLLEGPSYHFAGWVVAFVAIFLFYTAIKIAPMSLIDIIDDNFWGVAPIKVLQCEQLVFNVITCALFAILFFLHGSSGVITETCQK